MDEDELGAGVLHHLAHPLPGGVEGGDGRADGHPAVAADLGGDPADPRDVGLAVLAGEAEPGAEVAAYDVAVEARDGAGAVLQQPVVQGLGERGLAAAGESGEEHDETALVLVGLVLGDDVRHLVGQVAAAAGSHDVGGRVGPRHLLAQRVVEVGVAVRGERDDDHRGRHAAVGEQAGRREGRADEADGGEALGRAGAGEGEQQDARGTRPLGHQVEVVVGQGRGDRDEHGTGVLRARLRRGQVQPAEGAVGRRGQRLE